jgi:hypothetical protein
MEMEGLKMAEFDRFMIQSILDTLFSCSSQKEAIMDMLMKQFEDTYHAGVLEGMQRNIKNNITINIYNKKQ